MISDHRIAEVRAWIVFDRLVFVTVRTDSGILGVGECSPMHAPLIAHFVNSLLAPICVGRDPCQIDPLWWDMYYGTYALGVSGLQLEAISGVDIALWDILGKATGLPVCVLLGGRHRDRVRMYASLGGAARATPAEMAGRVEQHLEAGYTAVKIRLDGGDALDVDPRKDIAVFAECRRACGADVPLAFDANCGYTTPTAIAQGRRLQELDAFHYEEPVRPDDPTGLARVVDALDVPVAAGEQMYTRWAFRDLLATGVDILQPDVTKCGGLSEARRIATLVEAHRRMLVPHMTLPTIGTVANLHFVASVRDASRPQEHTGRHPQFDSLFTEPLELRDGCFAVPTKPGLGIELDEAAFRRAAV